MNRNLLFIQLTLTMLFASFAQSCATHGEPKNHTEKSSTAKASPAKSIQVSSIDDLQRAIDSAVPGTRITVADGVYSTSDTIKVARAGTEQQPIIIAAQTVGGVEIKGDAGFKLTTPSAYVVIQGFVFKHKAGSMDLAKGVHHCRVTRNVFSLIVRGRATFLSVSGDDNEVDHNEFRDKSTEGQMFFVQGPGGDQTAKRTWIHHNYFHDFKNARRNNASALHIGSSWRSMTPAWSVVEYNFFERTVGENEGGICNKSTDNIYRYNTMGENSSELSVRHGHRCQVYGNFFLGGNGIRFFGKDHRIFSNYFENCRPAIAIGNGGATIPPGPLVSHERPDRVHIVYNTFVNNRANVQLGGRRNGLGSNNLVFANNIILGGGKAVSIEGPLANPTWEGNIVWNNNGGPGDIPAAGFTNVDPQLQPDAHGIYRHQAGSPAIGNGVGNFPYVNVDIDGQPRAVKKDVGGDQLSTQPGINRPLTTVDVGPNAPESERAMFARPTAEWLAKQE